MKTLILGLSIVFATSAVASDCSSYPNLKYKCTNNEYVLCISENDASPGDHFLEIGRHNGSSMTLQSKKFKETKKQFSIKEKNKVLLITVRLLDFRLNKQTMTAELRAFYSPLIEIGDGPSWNYNYDEEFVCE